MSPDFHADKVSLPALVSALSEVILAAERLDVLKKALFYGKDAPDGFYKGEVPIDDEWLDVLHPQRQKAIDIVHCIVGNATEAGELAEALYKAFNRGGALDVTNVAEEVGDCQWYAANLVTALGTTLDAVQTTNIAKLRKRYPEKFTSEAAINRDVDGEREVLER